MYNNQQLLYETAPATKHELNLSNIREEAAVKGGTQQSSPGGVQTQ